MTQRLFTDPESIATLRSMLERVGFDLAQEALRGDYLSSPFPHYETFAERVAKLDPAPATALRLLALGQSLGANSVETALGVDVLESLLATGLGVLDEQQQTLSTDGLVLASRLGQHFVVSANPYYPGFNPSLADVYLGPESLTLVNDLQRRAAGFASSGLALDLCCGSGIAGQSLGAIRRGMDWTAVDVSPLAVETATFNAALNDISSRYRVVQGDLFAPLGDRRFALIVANPPFIPVPEGVDFPVYGDGGEDGLVVMRPLLAGLTGRLTAEGRAVVYVEGIGDQRGPLILDVLGELAANGHSIGVTLLATMTVDQALFAIGRLLSMQRPSRLEELSRWQESFARQGVVRYDKMLIDVRPGTAGVVIRSVAAMS